MPVKHKPGKVIRGYEIEEFLNNGGSAFAYLARKGGKKIFLKQYKHPAPGGTWFDAYQKHASEIKKRIQNDEAARTRCYEMIEFFTEKDFFQAFEFVEGGMSLEHVLINRSDYDWDHLVVFAKVLVSAVAALHNVGVVHTDLKPPNVYFIPDSTIGVGYRLRIIDLDFAIVEGQVPAWVEAKEMGYMGSPGHYSPEHLRGQMPQPLSDAFTCAVMLGQLLCGYHPLGIKTIKNTPPEELLLAEKVTLAGSAIPIRIPQPIKKVENLEFLEGVLNSALCPDPARRPTVKQMADALMGKPFDWTPWTPSGEVAKISTPVAAPPVSAPATSIPSPVAKLVKICFVDAEVLTVRVDTALGKNHFLKTHEDAKFLSNPQFHLARSGTEWTIRHDPAATNATLVDGVVPEGAVPLRDGMVVAVGNPAKGITKFPLTIRLATA